MSPELSLLCQLLRAAATQEILPRFRVEGAMTKADGSLVTLADLKTQAFILGELQTLFPAWPVLGEEMSPETQAAMLADGQSRLWCLDPLDGTSNFAGGFPFFAISLALLEAGQVRWGLVLDPVRDECFVAERGQGAWLNGVPLPKPARSAELKDCLALVDLKRLPPALLSRLGREAPYRSQRSLGAVALEWCWLAAGRAQLYLHGGQRLWDYAAGSLIANEAGVSSQMLPPHQEPASPSGALAPQRAVAAANQKLLDHWRAWVDSA